MKRRKESWATRRLHNPPLLLLAAPLIVYMVAMLGYPVFAALRMALTDALAGTFPSTANFRTLAGDSLFARALAVNLLFPVISVALELLLGLGLALLFAQRFPGRGALRAIAVIPFALPEIVYLTAMRSVFAPRGYANALLMHSGLPQVDWLAPGSYTAFLTVVVVDAWHVTPVVFLILAAALAGIPQEIYSAARLDGASGRQQLRYITLPLLRPALLAALVLRGLDAVRIFAAPLVLTGVEGVPVLSSYAFHQWSDYGDEGAAAAAALVLAVLSVALAGPLLRRRSV